MLDAAFGEADAPLGFRNLINTFVKRKRTMFGEFRYLFGEAKFYARPDGEIRCRAEAKLPSGLNSSASLAE